MLRRSHDGLHVSRGPARVDIGGPSRGGEIRSRVVLDMGLLRRSAKQMPSGLRPECCALSIASDGGFRQSRAAHPARCSGFSAGRVDEKNSLTRHCVASQFTISPTYQRSL